MQQTYIHTASTSPHPQQTHTYSTPWPSPTDIYIQLVPAPILNRHSANFVSVSDFTITLSKYTVPPSPYVARCTQCTLEEQVATTDSDIAPIQSSRLTVIDCSVTQCIPASIIQACAYFCTCISTHHGCMYMHAYATTVCHALGP